MTHSFKGYSMSPADVQKRFSIHLTVFLITIPALWLIWYLTGLGYPWPVWNTSFWGAGILFHYMGVRIFKGRNANHPKK